MNLGRIFFLSVISDIRYIQEHMTNSLPTHLLYPNQTYISLSFKIVPSNDGRIPKSQAIILVDFCLFGCNSTTSMISSFPFKGCGLCFPLMVILFHCVTNMLQLVHAHPTRLSASVLCIQRGKMPLTSTVGAHVCPQHGL